jgi:hypothetical protein
MEFVSSSRAIPSIAAACRWTMNVTLKKLKTTKSAAPSGGTERNQPAETLSLIVDPKLLRWTTSSTARLGKAVGLLRRPIMQIQC